MNLLTCFYTFMTALFTTLIVVPFLRKWALDQGTLDLPGERKLHDTPMPRLGGIAIFLSFLLSVIIYVPITPAVRGLLAGGLIIFITGLVDDLTELSPKRKFAGEVAACLTTIVLSKLWLVNLGNLLGFGEIILPAWLGIPFTVFAVVGVINAINLIDGLDGLAGGVSVMALAAFFVLGWLDGDQQTTFIAAAMAGALLGFLKYNFYPARIFMGDAGSLTVGFVLGFLAVYTTQQQSSTISPMVPIMILGLPLLDTVWVMSRRVMNRESPFAADRTHVHHKFLDLGFEHRFTVIIIYGLMFFWVCSALLLRSAPEYLLLLFMLVSASLFYLSQRYVLRHQERFAFLTKDTALGLRSSVTYLRLADSISRAVPGLLYLLIAYVLLAFWSVLQHNYMPWQMSAILLVAGVYLYYRPLSESRQFLRLFIYFAVGAAAVEVWHADLVVFAGLTIKRIGDILLAAAAIIVFLKIQFRRDGEFFLSTADFLALAICIFLSIASQHNALGINLTGPLLRAVIVMLMVRTLCSRHLPYLRPVAGIAFVFLALATVVGLVG